MEWAHVLAIVMPVMFAIIIGIFYNNRRIDDVNHRIDDLRSDMNQRFAVLHEEIREIKNLMMEFLKRESGYTIRDK